MIIAVANQKGGVGKTTTSQALAAGLAAKGYRVLGLSLIHILDSAARSESVGKAIWDFPG